MLLDGSVEGRVVDGGWMGVETQTGHGEACDQVHRRLKRIVKARGSLDLQEAAALREAYKLQIWRRYGYSSMVDYMERELGYSPRAGLERLRVANAIVDLPQIAAAIEQGDLTFSGARELTRVATPETEQVWIGATAEMNLREVEQVVSGHVRGELPTDPPDPRLQRKILRHEVRLETDALMREARQKLEKERGERLDDDAVLEALCRAYLEGPGAGEAGESGAAPYRVAVTVCKQCKGGWQHGAGAVAEMTPAAVERAQCDAQEIGDVDSPTVERASQTIPPATRRKVKHRDQGTCRVPGCRASQNVDIHHIKPRAEGGGHSVDNLITLCEAHHLQMHEQVLLIRIVDGEVAIKREGRNRFTRETRAIEAAKVLRQEGMPREVVRVAIERTRTHVGTEDLSLQQWVEIARRYLR